MMMNSFKKAVKPLVAGVLALGMAATPAFAGDGFVQKDLSHEPTKAVQGVAEELSDKKITYVVHTGDTKMWQAVHHVANYFDGEGEDVALFISRDVDEIADTTHVEIFYKGFRYGLVGFSSGDIKEFQQSVYDQTVEAKNKSLTSSVPTKEVTPPI